MDARASENSGIVHGTPHTDGMEGTDPSLLADNNNDIKVVDMPGNEPVEIINVDTYDATYGQQEDLNDDNTGDKPPKNQCGVSNTDDNTYATDEEDTTKDRAAVDNPKFSIKVEDVDDYDDGNGSDDDADNILGVDGRYPKRKRNHKEYYIPSHWGKQYKQGIIYIQTQGKYCDMSDDDRENYMLGIIMAQYNMLQTRK